MPLIRVINVVNSHDSDSETDAPSAAELKNEREERQADVAALWAELHRLYVKINLEEEERRDDVAGPWRAIRSLTFDDIHGMLEGERSYATGYKPKTT